MPASVSPQFAHGRPEPEYDHSRLRAMGFDAAEQTGTVRCLRHGYPTPLARWHFHEEYELHLIVASRGSAFVGDWIGDFGPGHLVLAGPRLPHNWVTTEPADQPVETRDLVIQFPHAPIEAAAQHIHELAEVLPMLQRSRRGIEFFGMSELAEREWHRVAQSRGLRRLSIFMELLHALAHCTSFRVLSSMPQEQADESGELDRVHALAQRLLNGDAQPAPAGDLAGELGMSVSRFSRCFRRATGRTFTDFANRVRVNQACKLLMESDALIKQVCFEAGFNNLANFNRRFIEIKGMTPSEFRRRAGDRFGQAPGWRLAPL
jgi:AraC-like DNA-binding protein